MQASKDNTNFKFDKEIYIDRFLYDNIKKILPNRVKINELKNLVN